MSENRGTSRGSKAGSVIGVLVVIAVAWWGVTYIPVVREYVPSLVSIEPTTRFDIAELPANANTIPAGMLGTACHNIPFIMRPLAGGSARTARIIFADGATDLGEIRFYCHDGTVLSDQQY